MPRLGSIFDLEARGQRCSSPQRICSFRLHVAGVAAARPSHPPAPSTRMIRSVPTLGGPSSAAAGLGEPWRNDSAFDARYRSLTQTLSSEVRNALDDPSRGQKRGQNLRGGGAQHVITLPAGEERVGSLGKVLQVLIQEYIGPHLQGRAFSTAPRLQSVKISRNMNLPLERVRSRSMLWHWDSLTEGLVKVVLYLSPRVDHRRGCMVVLTHNETGQTFKVQHDAAPWGRQLQNVPKPWLIELFERGYRPQCILGTTGDLIVFDTNIVHRGSRPAPGMHRDFILFEFVGQRI